MIEGFGVSVDLVVSGLVVVTTVEVVGFLLVSTADGGAEFSIVVEAVVALKVLTTVV